MKQTVIFADRYGKVSEGDIIPLVLATAFVEV